MGILARFAWNVTFLETHVTSSIYPTIVTNVSCYMCVFLFKEISDFLCSFPDMEVRKLAVKWICGIGSDELVDYLPQLVVALRHETYENSPLAYFLLDRSLTSPRVAHHLFWLLSHNLPGTIPQVQCTIYF